MPLGKWKWPAVAFVLAYFFVSIVLPLLTLGYASTQPYYSPPTHYTLTHLSGANYPAVFHDALFQHAVKNSLILGVGSATAVMLMTAVAGWVVVRTKLPGRWLIDNLAFMPLVIPGLVLGVAMLDVYLRLKWLPIYGTLWILFIAYLTRYMPYGMRYAATSMFQIGKELEESAHDERCRLVPDVPADRPAVARAGLRGRLDLHLRRVVPRARQLGAALFAGQARCCRLRSGSSGRTGSCRSSRRSASCSSASSSSCVAIAYKLGARIGVRET